MATRKTTTRRSTEKQPRRAPAMEVSRRALEGGITVREAGRKGGLAGGRKGGLAVKALRGIEYFQVIGRLGGQRVRDLVAAGRRSMERPERRSHT